MIGSLKDKKQCCGCNACAQICPTKSIVLQEDAEGFAYPQIDSTKCVECQLCEKVCPIIVPQVSRSIGATENKAYAIRALNTELRLKSSSGGIFTLLAEKVIDDGGVVFGAAFDQDLLVHHTAVETIEELEKLRGSKYLQSKIKDTFSQAKSYLENDRTVLFSGTACQIAGLKNYLRKDYSNLYTIDILCHGVPSPLVWKKYIEWKEKQYQSNVTQVAFRNKNQGWKRFSVLLEFSDNSAYEKVFTQDLFMSLFLDNICLRPSCHDCRYKSMDRPSDITLGDCWGIEKTHPEIDDDKGTSIAVVHTERGEYLFSRIEDLTDSYQASLDFLLPPNADSRKSVGMHKNRGLLFKMIAHKVPFGMFDYVYCDGKKQKLKWVMRLMKKKLFGVK